MQFTKMQAAGNDYVYVDCLKQPLNVDPQLLARRISDRHTGVGADGLILIEPSATADARMRMFNADGGEAGMCGNGLRCVGKYLHDRGLVRDASLRVETGQATVRLTILQRNATQSQVCVELGPPRFAPGEIPAKLPGPMSVDVPLAIGDQIVQVTALSLGNPHCVLFLDEADDETVLRLGPQIERHEAFPEQVNVSFVEILTPGEIRQRTWERGSGETRACGSGAAAACVAGVLCGRLERQVLVHMPGGDLSIHWREQDDHLALTGSAHEVFTGVWPEAP